jgi:O-glycosyl hydrolase
MKEKNTVVALAQRTIRDLLEMEATVWCTWQFIDDHPAWGSLVADWKAGTWRVGGKFPMEAQFSRFIRPGFAILATPAADTLAALDPKGATLVLVAVNAGEAEEAFTADLSRFRAAGPQAEAHRTSDTEACQAVGPVAVEGQRLRASLPKASITTFVVPVRR